MLTMPRYLALMALTKDPTTVNTGTVPPQSIPHSQKRPREYLTPHEVEALIAIAHKWGRYGHRDATMILLAYRHGLRVSDLKSLLHKGFSLSD